MIGRNCNRLQELFFLVIFNLRKKKIANPVSECIPSSLEYFDFLKEEQHFPAIFGKTYKR